MGGIVNQLAFLPPQHEEEDKEGLETSKDLQLITTKSKNKIAALWYFKESNDYTILYSHGNAEDLIGSQYTFQELSKHLNVNLLAYDYEGYGLSEGKSSEEATYDDIESAYDWLTTHEDGPNISPSKIILFGRSLGSGPTIHLASKKDNLAGLILQSPLRTAIKTQLYHWLASSILRTADIFDNETKIVKVKNYPVLIIHGKNDRVVPFAHGEYLYQLVKAKNTCEVHHFWVEGCGHNDIEVKKGRQFRQELSNFVDKCIRNTQQSAEQTNIKELVPQTHSSHDTNDESKEDYQQ